MLALVLEFETAQARKSLVATRYMLATWVSLIFHCLLLMIVFFFPFFQFFFFSLVCEIKFSHCLFKMMGEIHCFCGNSSIPGSWLKFKLFTKFHQDQTPPEIRNHHPGKTEKADGGA